MPELTKRLTALLGLDDQLGTLTVGKTADIVAVAGNPIENIVLLQNVDFVMREGVVYASS